MDEFLEELLNGILRDADSDRIKQRIRNDLEKSAKAHKEVHNAYMKAGFTNEQAFELMITLLKINNMEG